VGCSLLDQKKYPEAATNLEAAFNGYEKLGSLIPVGTREETVQWLVELYGAWEKPDKTAEWQKRLAELDRRPVEP
jgi:hypothetical protein